MDIIKMPTLHKRDDKQQALNGKRISVEVLFSHSPRKHHIQLLLPLQLTGPLTLTNSFILYRAVLLFYFLSHKEKMMLLMAY